MNLLSLVISLHFESSVAESAMACICTSKHICVGIYTAFLKLRTHTNFLTLTKCFELHNQKDDLKAASITLTKRSSLHILEFWKYKFLNHNFALNVISFQYVNTFRIKSSACVFCSSEHIACEYMTKDIYIHLSWMYDIWSCGLSPRYRLSKVSAAHAHKAQKRRRNI